jgi:hypothetical protein
MHPDFTPPTYELLPIQTPPQNPPQNNNNYNPQTVVNNLLRLSWTTQTTRITEATFSEWRNQMSTGLEDLSNHTHLLKPSNLVSLLQHGVVGCLDHFQGIAAPKAAMCFPDRCRRVRLVAATLCEYLKLELREKHSVFDDETKEMIEFRGGMRGERRRLAGERTLIDASSLREEVEVNGVLASMRGRNGPGFNIVTDGVVTIHDSLRLNIAVIAAAIGCLSLRGKDGSDVFADETGVANLAVLETESMWFEDDDHYRKVFWVRVLPTKLAHECGCLQCKKLCWY